MSGDELVNKHRPIAEWFAHVVKLSMVSPKKSKCSRKAAEDSSKSSVTHEPFDMKNPGILLKEPYRLLFPLGILLTHLGLGVWILYFFWPEFTYPGRAHALVQMQSAMLCFVFGFLLTMMPNALGLAAIGRFQMGLFVVGLVSMAIVGILGKLALGMVLYLALLINFLIFIGRRISGRTRNPPPQFIFIFFAFLSGLLGGILEVFAWKGNAAPELVTLGRGLVNEGFLLLLVLGVGGLLFPRLFAKGEVTPQSLTGVSRSLGDHLHLVLAGLGLLLSYVVEAFLVVGEPTGFMNIRLGYGMRFAVAAWLILRLPMWRSSGWEFYLHFIRIALFSILLGLAMPILYPQYVMGWKHIIFIPGFLLITMAVASRVLASHGGNLGVLSAHRRWSISIGVLFLLGTSSRVSTEVWPGAYLLHLASASFFILAALWVWSAIFLPLVKVGFGSRKRH